MNNTRIMFLRNSDYTPCGCVAISIDRRNHRIDYQYSVLNPLDKFDRKMARHLALGRLVECPISTPLCRNSEVNMHIISEGVMEHLANSNAPKRAVRAAKLWRSCQEDSFDFDDE